MDILIKSFNRPYYLDRCLASIVKFVITDYRIVILDDGTPAEYLEKLQLKYPNITIQKSGLYSEKEDFVTNKNKFFNTKVPIDLWFTAAQNASEYFVLIEDDFWFISEIDLTILEQELQTEKIQMLKLFWLGNPKLINENNLKNLDHINVFKPNLYVNNPILYTLIFRWYRFKIRKIATFFKIYSKNRALNYYTIYATSGSIFNKKYFLSLWNSHNNSVDEGLQLYNAVKFVHINKDANFAYTKTEILKTGFLSSATNEHKKYKEVNIDMFTFNKIMNKAWLENRFDPMDNFPNDLDIKSIEHILDLENSDFAQKNEWQKWVFEFKKQFQSFGCKTD